MVLDALQNRPFTLVANLPYGVASPLIGVLATHPGCRSQHVTIQREVAQRLLAKPGTRTYGPLTIFVGAVAEVKQVGVLPPTCFWPQPKVESAIVSIRPRPEWLTDNPEQFGQFLHRLFSNRRKQLGTILGRDAKFPEGASAQMRPEQLEIEGLVALHQLNLD